MDTKMLKNDHNCGAKSGPNLIFLFLEWDNKEFNIEYLEDCVPEIFDLTQNLSDASSTSKSIEMPKLIIKSPPKKKLTQEKHFEEIINTNTQQLIQALNANEDTTPFDGCTSLLTNILFPGVNRSNHIHTEWNTSKTGTRQIWRLSPVVLNYKAACSINLAPVELISRNVQ
ncbi:hypothetical protein FF38_14256 [Lucilia cuprina]|uniref:Uncharacterized protein n=1 Tax=Lucilia cuprina TaxID=7375 RepID=A0A0L0CNK3_LUCCU|nr:hypothetical protein FF38_14256 [Lucilia cuprina]